MKRRIVLADTVFAEMVLWRLPRTLPGSLHGFKYRLALVSDGECVMRYDNEAGKGDHRHYGPVEQFYLVEDVDKLIEDFEHDIKCWITENSDAQNSQPE